MTMAFIVQTAAVVYLSKLLLFSLYFVYDSIINVCGKTTYGIYYCFPAGERSIAISLSVCLSVREHISGTAGQIFTNFCADLLWPWLSPPLVALRYVMYFRFYK